MSGSLAALGSAGNPGNYLQLLQAMMQPQQAAAQPNQTASVPLASMVDRLAPNAMQMQQQNPQLPWYAVPGMFRTPAPPNPALAATVAGQNPIGQQPGNNAMPPWMFGGSEAGGGGGGGFEAGGGGSY
jgi:hypothetical protein